MVIVNLRGKVDGERRESENRRREKCTHTASRCKQKTEIGNRFLITRNMEGLRCMRVPTA